MNEKISIRTVAEMLGVNMQTLRRWDAEHLLESHRLGTTVPRYYTEDQIEDFLSTNYKYLLKFSRQWTFNHKPIRMLSRFHCLDKSVFKARLSRLELLLSKDKILGEKYKFSLVTMMVGEIGNNSFDHNIGNWSDIRGIFFGYNLDERKIILADRGQGILNTLKRVKKDLLNYKDALRVAFTEYISGRSPENRGNGLKVVRDTIEGRKYEEKIKSLSLFFQSGDAKTLINYGDKDLIIENDESFCRGCFAELRY